MSNSDKMIKVDRVIKKYTTAAGEVQALKEISWEINRGEAIAIMGPSGFVFGPLALAGFFSTLGGECANFPFYPVVLYDENADRFIISADGNGEDFCVAVSQTADPTGESRS